jgi:transcriptional regulator with XRE-family HTH domain
MYQATPSPSGSPDPGRTVPELAQKAIGGEKPMSAEIAAIDPSLRAGDKLAEARRILGLTVDQVAERTRLQKGYIQALEAMNAKLLPAKGYTIPYLRSYANFLGLNAEAIVSQYQRECALAREHVQPQLRNPESKPPRERPWFWAAAILVIGATFVGGRALMHNGGDTRVIAPGQQAAVAPAAPTNQGPKAIAPVSAPVVELRALTDAQLTVRGNEGTEFFSGVIKAGGGYRPDVGPGWTLHAMDGGAFMIYVDGVQFGPLGEAGKRVYGRKVDLIAAEARAQAEKAVALAPPAIALNPPPQPPNTPQIGAQGAQSLGGVTPKPKPRPKPQPAPVAEAPVAAPATPAAPPPPDPELEPAPPAG